MSAIGTKRTCLELHCTCPLLGVKRTLHCMHMSALVPKAGVRLVRHRLRRVGSDWVAEEAEASRLTN